ncbi:hypothetical protein OAL52_00135 [bacterium]|nr:hypothetical protein [Akkermansiaceae bacterium]MDC0315137.1 hypothetical protein [bacterium]
MPEGAIVILEDETTDDPEFLIGRLMEVGRDEIMVRFVTGSGAWADEPSVIATERITSCQIDSNYSLFYARHFARNGDESQKKSPTHLSRAFGER